MFSSDSLMWWGAWWNRRTHTLPDVESPPPQDSVEARTHSLSFSYLCTNTSSNALRGGTIGASIIPLLSIPHLVAKAFNGSLDKPEVFDGPSAELGLAIIYLTALGILFGAFYGVISTVCNVYTRQTQG